MKRHKSYKKRHKLSKKGSRRLFTKTAKRIHPRNSVSVSPMRGGIRL
jgi:hypothetical protein